MEHYDRHTSFFFSTLNRRQVIKALGLLASALALGERLNFSRAMAQSGHESVTPSKETSDIPRRPLGRTGIEVSVLAIGGAHLGKVASLNEATRIVHEAVDAGIMFMDNAWEYHDGRSEEWMHGPIGREQHGV
jgi:hypothetical protein